jgi:hypothetical protein
MNYKTPFSGTENPISESSSWTNGLATGLDWNNARTTAGIACGTQTGAAPPPYDDSVAILTGTWAADQQVSATVARSNPQPDSIFEEVELFLRGTISAHSITGYEINTRVAPDTGGGYLQIVRWNGAVNDFTYLTVTGPGINGAVDGDVILAKIVGGHISVYYNGALVGEADDSTYTTGNPGMGFFFQGASGSPTNYGWKDLVATDEAAGFLPLQTGSASSASGTTIAVTLHNNVTAGNLVCIGMLFFDETSTPATFTAQDENGKTYTVEAHTSSARMSTTGQALQGYLIAPSGCGKTITVTFSKGGLSSMWVEEFQVVGGPAVYDDGAAADGTANPSNSPTVPVSGSNELVVNTTTVDVALTEAVSPWIKIAAIENGCGSAYIPFVNASTNAAWDHSGSEWSAVGMSFSAGGSAPARSVHHDSMLAMFQ